jgi:RNA polymerase sigma-70 factor, ECF subfamily
MALELGGLVERELVTLAAGGDPDAFAALARLCSNRLFAIAHRILRDHHLAEDALQQTLITIWDELPRLRDPEKFDAWSYRVIVRSSVAASRRERRVSIVELLPSDADPADEDHVRSIVDRDQLERAFRLLSPDHRAVIVLRHFEGLSLAQIAEVIGVPVGTAASRLHYAARELRTALDAGARAGASRERSA